MKKYLLLLNMLMACLMIQANTVVLDENMDNGLPTAWTQDTISAHHLGWQVDNTCPYIPVDNHGGCAYLLNPNYPVSALVDYTTRLITPVMDLDGLNQPKLIIRHAQPLATGGGYDRLKIYYRTTPNGSWAELVEYKSAISQWRTDTIRLIAASSSYQIALEGNVHMGAGVYIDEVKIESTIDCPAISRVVTDPTSFNVYIGIGSTAEAFKIMVTPQTITDWTQADTLTATYYNSYYEDYDLTVAGLSPNTHYNVYVSAACSDAPGGYDIMTVESFTTQWGYPYEETFDEGLGSDWTASGWAYNDSAQDMAVVIAANYPAQWLVSPVIDLSQVGSSEAIDWRCHIGLTTRDGEEVSDMVKRGARLDLMIREEGADWQTALTRTMAYGPMADWDMTETSASGRELRITLNSMKGKTVQLAWVAYAPQQGTIQYHLDNIHINAYDPDCGDATHLRAQVGKNTITATWQIEGREDALLELASDGDFTQLVDSVVVTSVTSHLFTNLEQGTPYYLRIKQNCSQAQWAKTWCRTAIGLDYDSIFLSPTWPDGWVRTIDGHQETTRGWSIQPTPLALESMGEYLLRVALSGDHQYGLESPSILLDAAPTQSVRLKFQAAIYHDANGRQAPQEMGEVAPMSIWLTNDGGATWQLLHDIYLNQIVQYYTLDLGAWQGQSVNLMFTANQSVGDNYIFVSDIRIEAYDGTCGGLQDIRAEQISDTAIIRWNHMGSNSVELILSTQPDRSDTLLRQVVNSDSILIPNLSSLTTYYVHLRQTCQSDDWSVMSFLSHCGIVRIMPWIEQLNDSTGNITQCWTVTGNSEEAYNWTYMKTGGRTGGYYRFESGNNPRGAMGRLSSPAIYLSDSLVLGFYLRNRSGSALRVMVGDSTVLISDSTLYLDWQLYKYDLSAYYGQTLQISWEATSNRAYTMDPFVMLDDITLTPVPKCLPVSGVRVSNITSNGATITHNLSDATQYQVLITSQMIDPELSELKGPEVVYNQLMSGTQHTITSSQIESNTRYYAYVRGYCGNGEYGNWSAATMFRTVCSAITPEEMGIESFDNPDRFNCWITGYLEVPTENLRTQFTHADHTTDYFLGSYLYLSKELPNQSSANYRDGAYAITPELDIDSITGLQLVFQAGTNSHNANNVHRLNIAVVTDPGDLSTITDIQTVNLEYAAYSHQLSTYVVSLAEYEGDYNGDYGKRIMFISQAGEDSTNFVVIDNVRFEVLNPCYQPSNLAVDSIRAYSALFQWDDMEAEQYEVMITTLGGDADTIPVDYQVVHQFTTEPSLYLSSLLPNTQYFAYVRVHCDSTHLSAWSYGKQFTTSFGMPYVENFTTLDDWTRYYSDVTYLLQGAPLTLTDEGWFAQASPSVGNISGKHAICQVGPLEMDYCMVSPRIDLSNQLGENLVLTLKLGLTSPSITHPDVDNLAFYLMVSTDDGKTWRRTNSYEVSENPMADYSIASCNQNAQTLRFYMTHFTSQSIRLALAGKLLSGSSDVYVHVGELRLDTCSYTPFEGVFGAEISNITAHDAQVDMLTRSNLIIGAYYRCFPTGSDMDQAPTDYSSSPRVILSDLESNTDYDLYIRALSLLDDTSEWCGPITFHTGAALPYTESFDHTDLPYGWTIGDCPIAAALNGLRPQVYDGGWKVMTTDLALRANHLGININASTNERWFISPQIDMSGVAPDENLELSFDMAYTQHGTDAPVDSALNNQTLWLLITNHPQTFWTNALVRQWSNPISGHYTVDCSAYRNQQIHVAWVVTSQSGNNDFHIANLHIGKQLASCGEPSDLQATMITQTSAQLSWTGNAALASVVQWAENRDFTLHLHTDTCSQGLSYQFTNLEPSHCYYVRVKQLCSTSDETCYTPSIIVNTECALLTEFPIVETFDHCAQSLPLCYEREAYSNHEGTYPSINPNPLQAYDGTSAMLFYGGTAQSQSTLILPATQDPISTFRLRMWYKQSNADASYGELVVGTLDDNGVFTPIETLPRVSTYAEADVNLASAPQGASRLAIRFMGGTKMTSAYVDHIRWSRLSSCQDIMDLHIDAIGAGEATLGFTHAGAMAYRVELNKGGEQVAAPDSVSTLPITFTGLVPGTDYTVRLKPLCGGGEEGDWTPLVMFTTQCAPLNLPYSETFKNASSQLPNCWTKMTTGDSYYMPVQQWTYNANGYQNGCMQLRTNDVNIMNDYTSSLTSPELILDDAATLQFQYRNTGATSLRIALSVDGNPNLRPIYEVNTMSTDWQTEEVDLSDWIGHVVKVYFIGTVTRGGVATYMGLDEVLVQAIGVGQTILSAEVTHAERNALTLGWKPRPNAPCTNYELVYGTSPMNDSVLNANDKLNITDTTAYRLDGLSLNTAYYVYLRTMCGTSPGDWVRITGHTQAYVNPETLVVAPGGDSQIFLPLYGARVLNETQRNQLIYPADSLTSMIGATITQLKFFATSGSNVGRWDDATCTVRLGSSSQKDYQQGLQAQPAHMGYTGRVVVSEGDGLIIQLSQPYLYEGGDLLIECGITGAGANADVAFRGQLNLQALGYCSYTGDRTSAFPVFQLPMCEFSFMAPSNECPTVGGFHVESLTDYAIHVEWAKMSEDTSVNYTLYLSDTYPYHPDSIINTYAGLKTTSMDIDYLSPQTTYYLYIQAHCSLCEDSVGIMNYTKVFTEQPLEHPCIDVGYGLEGGNLVTVAYASSYSQHIFTAEELHQMGIQAGNIESVAFYFDNNNMVAKQREQTIWIGTTLMEAFPNHSIGSFVPVQDLEQVYGPILNGNVSAWRTYSFVTPYHWDGQSNLVLAMLTNAPAGDNTSSAGWYTKATQLGEMRSIACYQNYTIDPEQLNRIGSNSEASYARVNTRFCFTPDDSIATPEVEPRHDTPTLCDVCTIPFYEDFDSILTGIPDCWSIRGACDPTYNWYSYAEGIEGRGLRFNSYNTYNRYRGLLLTPYIYVDSLAELRFWYRNPEGGELSILINDSIVLSGLYNQTEWTEEEVDLSLYQGQTIQICFAAQSNYLRYGDAFIYLDDVEVVHTNGCNRPTLQVTEVGLSTASLVWTGSEDNDYLVEYSMSSTFDTHVDSMMVTHATHAVLNNLLAHTRYYVRVTTLCGSDVHPSHPMQFQTQYGLPFLETFDEWHGKIDGEWAHNYGSITAMHPVTNNRGWKAEDAGSANFQTPFIYEMQTFSTAIPPCFTLVSPKITLNPESGYDVVLSMDIALTTHLSTVVVPNPLYCNQREFMITISTDGGQTWNTNRSWRWGPGGNQGEYTDLPGHATTLRFDLSEYIGQTVQIALTHNLGSSTRQDDSYLQIDNFSINQYSSICSVEPELSIQEVSLVGTQVHYTLPNGVAKGLRTLSKENSCNIDRVIVMDTIQPTDSIYMLPDLESNTTYYVFAASLCSDSIRSAWHPLRFTTPLGIPYNADFDTRFDEWTLGKQWASSVFNDSLPIAPTLQGWHMVHSDKLIPESHLSINYMSDDCDYWIFSPSLATDYAIGGGLILSFDASLSRYNVPGTVPSHIGQDDQFIVAISTDEGQTWSQADSWLWQNDTAAQYPLSNLSGKVCHYELDMTRYAGQVVKLGFYAGSLIDDGNNNDLHLGRISLDRCDAINLSDTICYGQLYQANGFMLSPENLHTGLNICSRLEPATETNPAQLIVLSLMVNSTTETDLYLTACEGEALVFDEHISIPFGIIGEGDNTFLFRLTGSNGCDSLVTVHVTGIGSPQIMIEDSTCNGVPYLWQGRELYVAGTYTDTLTSSQGCDSIVTLLLSVMDQVLLDSVAMVCYGERLIIDGQPITQSGTYQESFITSEGCDGTRTWYVTIVPDLSTSHTETICKGDEYLDDLFQGLSVAGTYTNTVVSAQGCDSTVTLYLLVIDPAEPDQYITYQTKDLPLIIEGEEVLPLATEPGEYTYVLDTECGMVTYHITLTLSDALDEVTDPWQHPTKVIEDNQLIIYVGGRRYTVLGQE